MKRATAFALLLVHVFTLTAEAARVRYISPTGSNSNNGQTSGAPWQTFSYAMGQLIMRDTLVCLPSSTTYADGIVVADPELFIIGDSTAPNKVKVPSLTIVAGSGGIDLGRVSVHGIRFTGNVSVTEFPCCGNADGFLMRNCVVAGNTSITDTDYSIYNSRLGLHHDSTSSSFWTMANTEIVNGLIDSCVIRVAPLGSPLYTGYAMQFGSEHTSNYYNRVTMRKTQVTLHKPDGWNPSKPTIFRGLNGCRFSDNKWTFQDSSGLEWSIGSPPTEGFGLLFRDDLNNNLWLRDTFDLVTLRAGKGRGHVDFTGSGGTREGGGNVLRYCVLRSNMEVEFPFRFDWQMQDRDSLTRSVVACSAGAGINTPCFWINNVQGQPAIYRNTFFNASSGGCLALNYPQLNATCNPDWDSNLSVKENIFYTRSTGTGSSDYAMSVFFPAITSNPYSPDYNLYAHYVGSGGRSVFGGRCFETAALYSPATMFSSFQKDQHSRYGSPQFVDTTWANFNPELLVTSPAIGMGATGSEVGARDRDGIRPEEVSDLLAIMSSSTQAIIRWTATGDDSLSGTGTTYTIKYSSLPMNDGTWATDQDVSTEPVPLVAGTVTDFFVTGLDPNTLYYFALKMTDEFGNESLLSNVASIMTQPTGTIEIAEP